MFPSKNRYLKNLYSRIPLKSTILSQNMEGVTPPSVFVGRVGYPKVSIGPMMTLEAEDPVTVDRPENWTRKTVEDILSFRMQLVRGKHTVNVKENNSFVQNMQEIALAKNSVDIETQFTKIPTGTFINEEIQPYGPSAPIKSVSTGNIKMEKTWEKSITIQICFQRTLLLICTNTDSRYLLSRRHLAQDPLAKRGTGSSCRQDGL